MRGVHGICQVRRGGHGMHGRQRAATRRTGKTIAKLRGGGGLGQRDVTDREPRWAALEG